MAKLVQTGVQGKAVERTTGDDGNRPLVHGEYQTLATQTLIKRRFNIEARVKY